MNQVPRCFFNLVLVWFIAVSFIGGVPGKKHRLVANHRQTLSHNVISSTPRHEQGLNSGL